MAPLCALFVIAFFISSVDSTCTCGGCVGPNNAYCVKNHVQCKSGNNDNPLISDVDKVLAAYKKVVKVLYPNSDESKGYHVGSHHKTLFVTDYSKELCTYVCQELDNCAAVEWQWRGEFHPYMTCAYAYACDSTIPWQPAHKLHTHGVMLDTAHHDKEKSLSVDQGQDYVPYSEAKAHSDIEDVSLTFDYYFYFAVAVVAFLFFGIGIFLGLAIKKYPKQVQYPQL